MGFSQWYCEVGFCILISPVRNLRLEIVRCLLSVTQLIYGRTITWIRILTPSSEFVPRHQSCRSTQLSHLPSPHAFCCHHIVSSAAVVEGMGNNPMVSFGEKSKGFLAIVKLCYGLCFWTNFCFFPSCLENFSCFSWKLRSTQLQLFCLKYESLMLWSKVLSDPDPGLCVPLCFSFTWKNCGLGGISRYWGSRNA